MFGTGLLSMVLTEQFYMVFTEELFCILVSELNIRFYNTYAPFFTTILFLVVSEDIFRCLLTDPCFQLAVSINHFR